MEVGRRKEMGSGEWDVGDGEMGIGCGWYRRWYRGRGRRGGRGGLHGTEVRE
jgi:hypothetical protein